MKKKINEHIEGVESIQKELQTRQLTQKMDDTIKDLNQLDETTKELVLILRSNSNIVD